MNALTSVGFAGALGNRGRGRGRGRGATSNRFPQTFGKSNIKESEKPPAIAEEEKANDQKPRDKPMSSQPGDQSGKIPPSQQQ